jgi:hypothetical protein
MGASRVADALGHCGGMVCAAILDSEVLFDVLPRRLKSKIVIYDIILDRCSPGHDILTNIPTDAFYRIYESPQYWITVKSYYRLSCQSTPERHGLGRR